MSNKLDALVAANGIPQAELARGIGRSRALVSRLLSGEVDASRTTINRTLSFLSKRLGRDVTYEEAFGSPLKRRRTRPAEAQGKR